jgi:predicted DCC family thiol-disulfide oxidoreductase YuxK
MKHLTVLYDAECQLCQRCRQWLARQPAYFPLRFLPLQTALAQNLFPGLAQFHPARQLVCVSDLGEVYVGDGAWIVCLYALRGYREWSRRLARPALRPYAARICNLVSQHRLALGRWTGAGFRCASDDHALISAVERAPGPATSACTQPTLNPAGRL